MTLYKGMPGEWRRPQEKEKMDGIQASPGDEELIRLEGEKVAHLLPTQEEQPETIKFRARVWKVGTLGTGGLRVQLNLDQEFIKEMAMLAECQHDPEMELEFEARQSEDGALQEA